MICHGCGAPMTSHTCSYCLRVSDTLTIRPAPKNRYAFGWTDPRGFMIGTCKNDINVVICRDQSPLKNL